MKARNMIDAKQKTQYAIMKHVGKTNIKDEEWLKIDKAVNAILNSYTKYIYDGIGNKEKNK